MVVRLPHDVKGQAPKDSKVFGPSRPRLPVRAALLERLPPKPLRSRPGGELAAPPTGSHPLAGEFRHVGDRVREGEYGGNGRTVPHRRGVFGFRLRAAAGRKRQIPGVLISGVVDRGKKSGVPSAWEAHAVITSADRARPPAAASAGAGSVWSCAHEWLCGHETAVDRARPHRLAVAAVPAPRSLRPFAGSPRSAL
jgi:hypothetical protein